MRKSEIEPICKRSKIVSTEKMSRSTMFKEKEDVLMDVRLLRYMTKKHLVSSIILKAASPYISFLGR
jgi:hypothetical protein